MDDVSVARHLLRGVVDHQLFSADDAALAPASGNDGRVARLAAGGSKNALGDGHAADVLGTSFTADQHNLFAPAGPILGLVSAEHNLADGGPGNGVDAGA